MEGKLEGSNILVLGLGVSGVAAAELARMQNHCVTVLDSNSDPTLDEQAERLREKGVDVKLDWNQPTWPKPVDLAVISPGISPHSVLGRLADALSCPVISELEFGYRHCSCPILAVTGTNGKTTSVELITFCLKSAGKRAMAAGNVGLPLSEACRKSSRLDVMVVEVSSFQLERVVEFNPLAATCLNISSDHQDRYPDFAAYVHTKLAMFARMTQPGQVVLTDAVWARPEVRELPIFATQPPLIVSTQPDPGDADYFLDADGQLCWRQGQEIEVLMHRDELKLHGNHNIENVLAALALCRLAGVPHETAAKSARRFAPSAHRLELLSVSNGVRYINDSKATNPDSLIQALRTCAQDKSYRGKVLLIAGGRDKGMDFAPVLPYIQQNVKEVYLLGENRDQLEALWAGHVPCRKFSSMTAVVEQALENAQSGDTVLLSPGCASHDMFQNYADRGNQFIQALRRRLGE